MEETAEFEEYLEHLAQGLGHADRRAGLRGYCTGLLAPIKRKSVEPMASWIEPQDTRSRHQSLHHFVAQSGWSDEQMLRRVAQWVVPAMDFSAGGWWVVDDTSFPKQGEHSVGVTRQYSGVLGKQDNCQVAVSVTLASQGASLPVAWQLYLPKAWAEDEARRKKAGVPESIAFATKPAIALQQLQRLLEQGAPAHCVLADAGYGTDTAFREGLAGLGLPYIVGVSGSVSVWPPGHAPQPAQAPSGRGAPGRRLRIGPRPEERPQSVKAVAMALAPEHWREVNWTEGSNFTLRSRFARVRVRAAHRDATRHELRPEQWLLIEWPQGHKEPMKYWLGTIGQDVALESMVLQAKLRWRIERDYQDLKQDLGLGDYEGRNWRGFHHHASLAIAAYGFLMARRLRHPEEAEKKSAAPGQEPALPTYYKPRGSPAHAAPRLIVNHHPTIAYRRSPTADPASMSVLPAPEQSDKP